MTCDDKNRTIQTLDNVIAADQAYLASKNGQLNSLSTKIADYFNNGNTSKNIKNVIAATQQSLVNAEDSLLKVQASSCNNFTANNNNTVVTY